MGRVSRLRSRFAFTFSVGALALLIVGAQALPLLAQDREGDNQSGLNDRVDELVEMLSAEDDADREAALEELLMMPPEALNRLREHLERAQDPELEWRLSEAIEALEQRAPRDDDADEEREEPLVQPREHEGRPPQFDFDRLENFRHSQMVIDQEGRWHLESRNGQITVTFTPRGANEPAEVREFDSFEEFREQWPEAARRFPQVRGRVTPRLEPPGRDGEDDDFPRPFPHEEMLPGESELLERLLEDLMGGGGMPELDELLEDLQRRTEEMQRRAEEMQREAERHLERFGEGGDDDGMLNELLRRFFDGTLEDSVPPVQPGEDAPREQQQQDEARGVLGTVHGTEFRAVPPAIRAQLQLGEREGLLVERVGEAGPLTDAGLQRYDLLLAIDGKPVESVEGVRRTLNSLPEGAEFTLTVVRRAERAQLMGTR